MNVNTKNDQNANVSFVGATIHRSYGNNPNGAQIEVINTSDDCPRRI